MILIDIDDAFVRNIGRNDFFGMLEMQHFE